MDEVAEAMQVILLATGETERMRPLTEAVCTPMLPVLNRPVMSYPVMLLARQSIKQALVSLYHLGGSIEAYFGSGQRWGMTLDYRLQRDAWGTAGSLKWAASGLQQTFVVLPADRLVDVDLRAMVAFHQAQGALATVGVVPSGRGRTIAPGFDNTLLVDGVGQVLGVGQGDYLDSGVYVFEPEVLAEIPGRVPFDIHFDLLPKLLAASRPVLAYELDGYWNPLQDFGQYQAAQQHLLYSAVADTTALNGTPAFGFPETEGSQIARGIWVGRNHMIHPSARLSAPVYIGPNCRIGPEVELGPGAVIGANVMIDDGATVFQSTVLDNTYVGQLVNLENRVVARALLIDALTAEYAQIVDHFLLGEATTAVLGMGLQQAGHKLLALLLLLLLWPLLLLGVVVAWVSTGGVLERVPRRGVLPAHLGRGRQAEVSDLHLLHFRTCRQGVLTPAGRWLMRWEGHRLPELWSVVQGQLGLVGVKPLTLAEAAEVTEPWQQQRYAAMAGVTGLWYVEAPAAANLDTVLVTDTYYVATRNWREALRILWRTPGAWWRRLRQTGSGLSARMEANL